MRDFSTVVGIDGIDVLDGRHDLSVSRVITTEFIGVEPAGLMALACDQAAKEAHGGLLVASSLHQDINDVPILIDDPPEILMLPLNGNARFVEVPGVT